MRQRQPRQSQPLSTLDGLVDIVTILLPFGLAVGTPAGRFRTVRKQQSPAARADWRASASERAGMSPGRHIVFVAWRDLANEEARGSELLVDRLAPGLTARGDRSRCCAAAPSANGRRGAAQRRNLRPVRPGAVLVPAAPARLRPRRRGLQRHAYLAPLWTRGPSSAWSTTCRPSSGGCGSRRRSPRSASWPSRRVMPWVHRDNLFLTVSASTFAALREIGVDTDRIRLICNGVEPGPPPAPRSPEPLFLALGQARRVQADRSPAQALGPDPARHRRAAGHRGRRTGARTAAGHGGPGSGSPAGYRKKRSTG